MKPRRKYGAYERIKGTKRWRRRFDYASGSNDSMARLFQTWLMAAPSNTERQLRPIPRKKVS